VPAVIGIPQHLTVNYILTYIRVASKSRVTVLCEMIEFGNGGDDEWDAMVNEYMNLRADIGKPWKSFSLLLLPLLVLDGGGFFFFFVLSLDVHLDGGWRITAAALSFVLASSVLLKLIPLAGISNLCQSTDFRSDTQRKTLPQAAMCAVRNKPKDTKHAILFCTNVRNFPIGISLPGGINVSHELIVKCGMYLAVYGSTAAALILRNFLGEHGTSSGVMWVSS